MKIAINITRDHVAGITSSNINLLKHLLDNDHDFVGIELNGNIYMKGPILFRSFSPEVFDHHIINIHHLPITKVIKNSRNLQAVETIFRPIIKVIRQLLRETKPDIVLLSGTYFIPWLISIAAKKEGIPVVLWYAGVLTQETKHLAPKNHKICKAMERSIINRSKKIIFPSEICKTVVEKEVVGKKLKNSFIIPNPVSPIFTEHCATDQSMERRIAIVGRYTPIKNFDVFFNLHRILNKQNWRNISSFVTNLDRKIPKLPKTIKLIPPMTPEGLKRFYLTQGLIVCPSKFETFGNVPMEAACLGIPVLVSENMGCAEILKQIGLENMVVDFGKQDLVLTRIKELCGQYILPKQLNAIHKILDYKFVGDEIEAVLASSI